MKTKYTCVYIIGLSLLTISCNDSFLDKYPKDELTNKTFWKTDKDFRSYALSLYDFYGYGVGNDNKVIAYNSDETCKSAMVQDDRIWNKRIVPESGGSWNWARLRNINTMVEYANSATTLSDEEKKHWTGVARLFRAREYYDKVKRFNDVPWINKALNASSEDLFKPKDPRSLVMDSVLADLNYAVNNIREKDEFNQINRDVALAIKSEICLFEGTFRKYHKELNLNDYDRWLKECVSASEQIMNKGYELTPCYRDLYSSLDLSGNKEVILYKQYETGIVANCIQQQISMRGESTGVIGGTKDAIESFLCSDGLPYGISPLHPKAINGEPEELEEEFLNRDPRLTMCFVVPFRDNNPTQLPAIDEGYSGIVPPFMPCFYGEGYILSSSGYHPYKWWNPASPNNDSSVGITDAPIYSLNTILLNYAEAMVELGLCTNEVLDKSINKLRDRVGMPHLTLEKAEAINDPKKQKYAPEISSLLWEVRRERQVELMMDGTRLYDILRWKKASYFSKPFIGCYVDFNKRPSQAYNEDGSPKIDVVLGDRDGNVLKGATKGYILPYNGERQPVYSDDDIKLYYEPINKQDLVLNPSLTQSPGWDN